MDVEAATMLVEREVYRLTNKPLNDLQQAIVTKVWQGKKYCEIADEYGCSEGHAKDTGSLLWQLLSQAWQSKITKNNFRSVLKKRLKSLENNEAVFQPISVSMGNTDFIGREQAIADLDSLVERGHKIIVLQGEGGVGKTTLARQFLDRQGFELVLEVLMAKETSNIASAASIVEEWLQRDLNEDSGKEFGVTLSRLKRCLCHKRIGILIDNLEPALDRDGRLIAIHRDYLELLRILADPSLQSVTFITSRDRLCEAEISLQHYRLPGLDLTAWQSYFAANQIEGRSEIAQIQRLYGGNAKAMNLICAVVREDYGGAIASYCQEQLETGFEIDLKNLVASQFDRLQQLDIWAYRLLCRLGCYRYQDIARVSRAGLLCLLWDKPAESRAIISLRNRSLLEFAKGEYWLHPIVQAEARLRLQSQPKEWERSQREIAAFLADSISKINNIQDGLTALEAYYHYRAIPDYAAAARVILDSRENQWGQFLTLGTTLYRLGIIQPLTVAIEQIIEHTAHDRHLSELNNILGDLYWTTGQVYRAIACQEQTISTSRNCWQGLPQTRENRHDLYYWRMLEVDSLLSLGLYNIDLWELDLAADLFQQVIDLTSQTKHHAWAEKANLGLALINSHTDSTLDPHVSRLYRLIVELEDPAYNTGRFAYFMQMLGEIFFNYRQLKPAKTIWQRAIAFSQSSHYTQIEAKSLLGLGKLETLAGNLESANCYHQQAVELLTRIAAQCDLAEAYYQWGNTLQTARQFDRSQGLWQKAIALYQKIPAPKQVARVRRQLNKARWG